ncbi:hypothetical protein FHS55_002414 [Angulomicrobium tetraedrale]|uniref:Uncharacterized protein n=1 Tax=Ancylobacter tetraedralis TaxID=217068 RepID=A0A839ZAR1_9HYPH|nr:hypothetical protein [Ancylobacter tetraedralis]MBB3771805.1 hypothetical protein [Ancylobacter tetraedralis]
MADNQKQHDEHHGETVHSGNERTRGTDRRGESVEAQRRAADPQHSQTGAVHGQQGGQHDETVQGANERTRDGVRREGDR